MNNSDIITIIVGALLFPIVIFLLFMVGVNLLASWIDRRDPHTHFEGIDKRR